MADVVRQVVTALCVLASCSVGNGPPHCAPVSPLSHPAFIQYQPCAMPASSQRSMKNTNGSGQGGSRHCNVFAMFAPFRLSAIVPIIPMQWLCQLKRAADSAARSCCGVVVYRFGTCLPHVRRYPTLLPGVAGVPHVACCVHPASSHTSTNSAT